MKAKEYLLSIKNLMCIIANDKQKANIYREMAVSPSSSSVDGDRVCTSPSECAQFEQFIHKAEAVEETVNQKYDILQRMKAEMFQQIMMIDNCVYCRILSLRYIDLLSWEQISDSVSLSQSHVYRLHRQALDEFEKIFQHTQKDSA